MKKLAMIALIAAGMCGLLRAESMYGAFQVETKPSGADVTLYDPDVYLSQTPTPVYPVLMDEYMELREGIPGRSIMLMITKKGYVPLKRAIFVPFTHEADSLAIREPSVFTFELERDVNNEHWRVCVYYGYRHRHPRPPQHVHFHPWYPPHYPHHPGWGTPPPSPKPPVVYQGVIVSGTSEGPDLTASGSHSSDQPPSNEKPKPPKFQAPPPSKYVAPVVDSKPSKNQPDKKSVSEVKKNDSPKPAKSEPAKIETNKSKPVVTPAPKTEKEEEKDTNTKADKKSKK